MVCVGHAYLTKKAAEMLGKQRAWLPVSRTAQFIIGLLRIIIVLPWNRDSIVPAKRICLQILR